MVQTRRAGLSKRQAYRSRVKTSQCRGKTWNKCKRRDGCKTTKVGRKKSYCRKRSNRRL